MNTMHESDLPAESRTPPTSMGQMPARARPAWPAVVGIIGIILGGFGVLCGWTNYFVGPFYRWAAGLVARTGQPDPSMEAQATAYEHYTVATIVVTTIGLALSIWMIAASIGVVRRSARACRSLVYWAIADLIVLAMMVGLSALVLQAAAEDLSSRGEGQRLPGLWIGGLFTGCFTVVIGAAFPVFVIAWMSRRRIKADIATWQARAEDVR